MTARTKNSDLADVLELLLACRISPHEFHSMVADALEGAAHFKECGSTMNQPSRTRLY
jgi:hypothetical protein